VSKFQAAWDNVAPSHDIMRTRIVERNDRLFQVICSEPIIWDYPNSLQKYATHDIKATMLLGSPLTRFVLVQEAEENIFILTRHHVTFDGFSQSLINHEQQRWYRGEVIHKPPPFANFVRHLEILNPDVSKLYWQEQLREVAVTSFPVNISNRRRERAEALWKADIGLTKRYHTLATPAIVLRSAWALLVSKHPLSNDTVVGTTLSGRSAPVMDIDKMTGPTITTVPVRVCIDPAKTVTDFVSQMQEQSNDMIPHEHYGIQNISKISECAKLACQFDHLIVVHPEEEQVTNSLYCDHEEHGDWDGMSRTFAITLQVFLKPHGARIAVMYDADLLSKRYVKTLIGQFEHIVQQLCYQPDLLIGNISFTSPADESQIKLWTQDSVELVGRCVHHVFADRVEEAPDACAVLAWDGTLTYKELDDRSSRLAYYLVLQGICTEDIVPILHEKSMWTEICLLAVIKAGGAFLLLDPEHPQPRFRKLVTEVQAPLVLSSAKLAKTAYAIARDVCVINPGFLRQLEGFPASGTPPQP
jgi:hypothetical protein